MGDSQGLTEKLHHASYHSLGSQVPEHRMGHWNDRYEAQEERGCQKEYMICSRTSNSHTRVSSKSLSLSVTVLSMLAP